MPKPIIESFADLAQLIFPAYVTVLLDYYATGEGRTRKIYMLYALSAEALRKTLITDWGDYFCEFCHVQNGLVVTEGFEDLLPSSIHAVLKEYEQHGRVSANFRFCTSLHLNFS